MFTTAASSQNAVVSATLLAQRPFVVEHPSSAVLLKAFKWQLRTGQRGALLDPRPADSPSHGVPSQADPAAQRWGTATSPGRRSAQQTPAIRASTRSRSRAVSGRRRCTSQAAHSRARAPPTPAAAGVGRASSARAVGTERRADRQSVRNDARSRRRPSAACVSRGVADELQRARAAAARRRSGGCERQREDMPEAGGGFRCALSVSPSTCRTGSTRGPPDERDELRQRGPQSVADPHAPA